MTDYVSPQVIEGLERAKTSHAPAEVICLDAHRTQLKPVMVAALRLETMCRQSREFTIEALQSNEAHAMELLKDWHRHLLSLSNNIFAEILKRQKS